jgi:aldehyde:ferredoxin oxidoreductase
MPRGYAGKYLDVDLTKNKVKDTTFDEEILKIYLGGRGLATKILWDRLGEQWQKVDPLGPENIFTALTGPLTAIHSGARTCISGKSPLSNGVIGSTMSGEFASEIKCTGYDGVIVTGRASSPIYILVTDKGAEIRDASKVWGKNGEETIIAINAEVRGELKKRMPDVGAWREPALIYTGPAGENRVRNAAVMQKISHAAGYGGYGAVMGSKNLKAIAAKGRGPIPDVADPEAVKRLMAIDVRPRPGSMRRWGTGFGGYGTGFNSSSEPVRNWQEEWHDERSFGGPIFEARYWTKRYWSDFNCTTSCMKISCIKEGPYKGDITDAPDYELQAYCGANFGVFDPGENIHLSSLIDNLGFSGINSANTMAFAAELYQRGILTKEDLGFELKWGDTDAFTKLAYLIANRERIGDVLAEGTYRAALKISQMKGIDVTPYAVEVKGVEIGAHGIRSGRDSSPIAYALSPQAGDHTSTSSDGFREMGTIFSDSAVFCNFTGDRTIQWDLLKAITGWDITSDKWSTVNGPTVFQTQRALLLLGGPDLFWSPKDDDNPPRFYEPLPTGPYKGKAPDRKQFEEMKRNYYKNVGWDDNGVPTSETLMKLGLGDVDRALNKLRK